jgi:O-antigen/teichoic acid export membrane protein
MEEIAMLLFYLPIIIFEAMFEAMFEANENKRKAGVSAVIE